MRCARCDRLAIPQAVGFLPDGQVVFGWCLDCLEEAGCTEIEAVWRGDSLRELPRVLLHGPTLAYTATAPPDRRKLLLGITALLATWSIVLIVVGIWTIRQQVPSDPSPLGNGRPILLLAGGAATAATSLLLLGLSHGRILLHSRLACWWIQSGAFLIALAILVVGIVYHDPRRDPFVVAAAGLAIGLSIAAHWQERRLPTTTPRLGSTPRNRLQRH
ncbi:hypothetical protein V5E97_37525 [Singulisphaera sp. Ch08]|uniref:DUF1109 family protein n=1 Tax=Singulisphaera sp. Ch08 TaxID=3120278 RepID=A0AAU7CFB9_9BACT